MCMKILKISIVGIAIAILLYCISLLFTTRGITDQELLKRLDKMACDSFEYCYNLTENPEWFTDECISEFAEMYNATDVVSLRKNLEIIELNSLTYNPGPPIGKIVNGSSDLKWSGNDFLRTLEIEYNNCTVGMIQIGSIEDDKIDSLEVIRLAKSVDFSLANIIGYDYKYFRIPEYLYCSPDDIESLIPEDEEPVSGEDTEDTTEHDTGVSVPSNDIPDDSANSESEGVR